MAVAFGGLLGSSFPVLNQTSFYLVVSVLCDTFFIRALLVPSLMALLGRWNWWPRAFGASRTTFLTIEIDMAAPTAAAAAAPGSAAGSRKGSLAQLSSGSPLSGAPTPGSADAPRTSECAVHEDAADASAPEPPHAGPYVA